MTNETKNTSDATNKIFNELTIDIRLASSIGIAPAIIYSFLKRHPLMNCFGELRISYTDICYHLCFLTRKQVSDNIKLLLKMGLIRKQVSNDYVTIYTMGASLPINQP